MRVYHGSFPPAATRVHSHGQGSHACNKKPPCAFQLPLGPAAWQILSSNILHIGRIEKQGLTQEELRLWQHVSHVEGAQFCLS